MVFIAIQMIIFFSLGWFLAQKEIIIDFTKKSECKKCGEKDGGDWKYCSSECMEMLVSENNG